MTAKGVGVLSKRTAPPLVAEQRKRPRSAIEESFDEFICPITHELPFDPATAEDGKVYERKAIEKWLEIHSTSPVTNENMGKRLLPALQVKNLLRSMVRSGALVGINADSLLQKMKEEEIVQEAVHNAAAGDFMAADALACWYCSGEHGLAKDSVLSHKYSRMAVNVADDSSLGPGAISLRNVGDDFFLGWGTKRNIVLAVHFLTRAAECGSQTARLRLGRIFGEDGYAPRVSKDVPLARRYFSLLDVATTHDEVDEKDKDIGSTWLRKHQVNVKDEKLLGSELKRSILDVMWIKEEEACPCSKPGMTVEQMGAVLKATPLFDIKRSLAELLEGEYIRMVDASCYLRK